MAQRARSVTPASAPVSRAWALRLAGEVASHDKHVEVQRAAGHYREAAAVADRLELRLLRAHCHLGLGRLYRSAREPGARAELAAAVGAFRAMRVGYWVAVAESELSAV